MPFMVVFTGRNKKWAGLASLTIRPSDRDTSAAGLQLDMRPDLFVWSTHPALLLAVEEYKSSSGQLLLYVPAMLRVRFLEHLCSCHAGPSCVSSATGPA